MSALEKYLRSDNPKVREIAEFLLKLERNQMACAEPHLRRKEGK
jgi:hypothetical protein